MTNILSIIPRRQDIRTQTNVDWTDGFPIYGAGTPGVIRGVGMVGNGSLTVSSTDPLTPLGPYVVTISTVGTFTGVVVTDPAGSVIGHGLVGQSFAAGGFVLRLTQGTTAFALGDAFAIQPVPVPLDISGIAWALQVRTSPDAAAVAFAASSAPEDGSEPTILTDDAGGVAGLLVPYAAMARERFAPGAYAYDLIAIAEKRRVLAYYGALTHVEGVAYLPDF